MASLIGSLLRKATRKDGEPLNILTFPTHERYESGLVLTGHNFWAWRGQGIKDWNTTYAPVPKNYRLLNPEQNERQIPVWLNIDLVLSQNKAGQFQIAQQIARNLQVPLISLEHTLPQNGQHKIAAQMMRGDYNVFISEYSIGEWGFDPTGCDVIKHGVDTEIFLPLQSVSRESTILSVVNDWVNRDWCCGFRLWQAVTKDLPVRPVGDTPGLSSPAKSVADLVKHYNTAQIFINTSTVSPVPTALLEAMACGCAVVSTENCMIPEVIEHGENGFMTNDPKEMRQYLQTLLDNPALCRTLGDNARKTIVERFSMKAFVEKWNELFERAENHIFKG
jgi:hypothetical protein